VFLCFVENDAYNGSYSKNPFKFEHFNINSLACFVNGEQFPKRAYTPYFSHSIFNREYLALLNTINQYNNDAKTLITKSNFKEKHTIFGFDLSRDFSYGYEQSGYVDIPKNGILRFEIHFENALDKTINAIIYCEFDNLLSITEDKNTYLDFH
jgi:hypothetical protein